MTPPGEHDDEATNHLLRTQREANEQLILTTLRAQEATESAEQEVSELQETAAFRERLLAILGHDLKNPLGAVTIAAEMLLRRGTLAPADRRLAERILKSAERMGRLLGQVLEFTLARLGGGLQVAPREMDFGDVVRRVVDELKVGGRVDIQFESAGALDGRWDPDRLEEVLSNLVGNAVEHAAAESRVVVRALGSREEGLTAEVENHGAPIPPEVLPVIFQPFKRTSSAKAGTRHLGLGLYIAHEIVLAHGGTLAARSEGGVTTFTLRLPREPGRRPPPG